MNKKISSTLAIATIAILAIILSLVVWFSTKKIEVSSAPTIPQKISKPEKRECKEHIYEGSATINVWQIKNDKKIFLIKVRTEDIFKLPYRDFDTLRLVEPNLEIQEKLLTSSENNPVKLSVAGFANKCDELFLVSIEYRDGIFDTYLEN